MAKLTLSLGSNLGDRSATLRLARERITAGLGPIVHTSAVVETPAWGLTAQPDFLNQIVIVDIGIESWPLYPATSRHTAHRILDYCQRIEAELGRERRVQWGPRTIDIDLIFLDDLRLETERLSLPHPWWAHRRFVTDLLPARSVLAR